MSKIELKNMPRLKLADLLRRRKMTLEQFIEESGVQSYEGLVIRCQRIGVQPPRETEYKELKPKPVNSQQDGIVILEAPKVIDEPSGMEIDPDAPIMSPEAKVITDPSEGLTIIDSNKGVEPDIVSAERVSEKKTTKKKRRYVKKDN